MVTNSPGSAIAMKTYPRRTISAVSTRFARRPAAGVARMAASTISPPTGMRNQFDFPKSVISLKVSTTQSGNVPAKPNPRASMKNIASATSTSPATAPIANRTHGGSSRDCENRRARTSSAHHAQRFPTMRRRPVSGASAVPRVFAVTAAAPPDRSRTRPAVPHSY